MIVKRNSNLMADINVTPFVDVMLVLLVIFMITAPLMQHGMDVELPQESSSVVEVKEIPSVTIQNNRKIYWNDENVPNLMILTEKINQYLKNNDEKAAVYFRADKTLDYGYVMKVMTTIRRAGVHNIGMMTDPQQ